MGSCGHARAAALHTVGGVLYANAGNWVEHRTALVERLDGQLQIARPAAASQRLARARAAGMDRSEPRRPGRTPPAGGRAGRASA